MTTIYIDTQVEVDLDEISTDNLLAELKERVNTVFSMLDEHDVKELSSRVEMALAFNDKDKTIEVIADYFERVHGFNADKYRG